MNLSLFPLRALNSSLTRRALCAAALTASLAGPLASVASAAPTGGYQYEVDTVAPYTTDNWTLRLQGGEVTDIIVDGESDTDIDLVVRDQNGTIVASDMDNTSYCVAHFYVPRTQVYTIQIINRGRYSNQYSIEAD